MIADELTYRIRTAMALTPTHEQEQAIGVFCQFMGAPVTTHNSPLTTHQVMLLRGSAGTGKTTLAAAIVRAMQQLGQKLVLLAPTGRAAKVFSNYSGAPAYTIHRRIYRQKTAGDVTAGFQLNYNTAQDTLFMVDEASMISNGGGWKAEGGNEFGSGQLLDDLITFVYGGRNCRMLLIGDRAQLPPIGEEESPALMADVLRSYYLHVYETDLNQVLRQSEESGILWNATRIRLLLDNGAGMPKVRFQGFPDIHLVRGDELIEQLSNSYSHVGKDDTIVITRSNKRANIYNQGIRNTILDREEELSHGDMLMIVKNNYYWWKEEPSAFIANGDRAVVQRVRKEQELYGFRFAEVTMTMPDYDDCELTATVLLDTLTSEAPALTREQQTQLYESVLADYDDIRFKSERMKKLKEDRFYNALQVKYAYAVTCHKAQGGQWAHVYIDQGYMTDDMLTPDYCHWLYTAFTRATEQLYLVNWPESQSEK
jgi:ATP-dependent exoDNAse (exonuclease V) alpha subunit